MLKKIAKIIYIIELILFLIQFYAVYISLYCIMSLNYVKYVFLGVYTIYVIALLYQILAKKHKYREDIVNSFMNCGVMIYIVSLAFRINYAKMYVTSLNINYFNINYGVIALLIVFALIYTFWMIPNSE